MSETKKDKKILVKKTIALATRYDLDTSFM